ncbi:putative integral membrane protein [Flavobacteriales bacterium ALC-1]|nr:putative integral membrane protein [Flavobacteriales bacterium ALC-1]
MSDESKFDFSEEEQQQQIEKEKAVEEKKEAVKQDAKGLLASTKTFLSELFDFKHDTDRDATIEAIKADIPFKGATAWILICSIFVASVGLNADSTAVVIGAMLISPLMGPILGVGMSIALNDIDTLKKSLINLATMIVLSLLTAYIFFRFFPLGTASETSELLGRTKPDIRDVVIAFFGGLALIIARTKKGTIASVIFGVAIATALMPPLCTAGYSLAKGNWVFFGGAMNLFTINTIFIALATFIVLKVLRFPMLKYANSKKRKRIAQIASLVAIGVMIWPTLTFIDVYRESIFNNQAKTFIDTKVKPLNAQLFDEDYRYEDQIIELSFFSEINDQTKQLWNNEITSNPDFDKLKNASLKIKGNDTKSYELISSAYQDKREELKESKNIISGLQKEITELQENISGLNQQVEAQNASKNNGIAFSAIAKDAKIRFKELEYFGYAKMLESKDFIKVDTVTVASIKWNSSVNDSIARIKENELQTWLKQELKTEKIIIKRD